MKLRANMLLFKDEDSVHEFVLNGEGKIMGDSRPILYSSASEIGHADILFVQFHNDQSTVIKKYTICDDEKDMAEASIVSLIALGKLQEVVTELFKNLDNEERVVIP